MDGYVKQFKRDLEDNFQYKHKKDLVVQYNPIKVAKKTKCDDEGTASEAHQVQEKNKEM